MGNTRWANLHVRSYRAWSDWGLRRKALGEKTAYTTANTLLKRALNLAPDDSLALWMTAQLNLCDCVGAWSSNVAEQHALGEAALDRYLDLPPDNAGMLRRKADVYQLRGHYQESRDVLDDVLLILSEREPTTLPLRPSHPLGGIPTAILPRSMQMTIPKSSASPRIAFFGTAFLADAPVNAELMTRAIPAETPQFSSPRLDASFLINCGRFLTAEINSTPGTHVKRIAGSSFRSPKATVLYECSTDLRELLAALTPESAAEMATQWNSMYGKPNPKATKANGRAQVRFSTLKNLAVLAKQAKDGDTKLMLRVDYRKRR